MLCAFHVGNRGSNPLGDANNFNKLRFLATAVWGVDGSPDGFLFLETRDCDFLDIRLKLQDLPSPRGEFL